MRGTTSTILAGVFLLTGLVAFVVVALVLAGFREAFVPKTAYQIRLALADGAEGLIVGSPIKVGGITKGRVTGLRLEPRPDDRSQMDIVAQVSIDSDIGLLRNAVAYLQRPLLGGSAWFNLPSLGTRGDPKSPLPEGEAAWLAAGQELRGEIAPPEVFAQAGYGPEQRQQLQDILRSAKAIGESGERLTVRLDRIAGEIEADIKRFVATANGVADDSKAVTADIRARVPEWSDRVGSVLKRADESSVTLKSAIEKGERFVDSVQEGWAGVRRQLDQFLGTANTLADRVNTDGYKRVMDAVDVARKGLDSGQRSLERVERLLADSEPGLRDSLASFRMASDQLALTVGEVRRAPWKLLYQPGRKELEQELVFDAARRYAEAAGDLNRATQVLAQMTSTLGTAESARSPEERARLQGALDRMAAALGAYDSVEREFLARLRAGGVAQPGAK